MNGTLIPFRNKWTGRCLLLLMLCSIAFSGSASAASRVKLNKKSVSLMVGSVSQLKVKNTRKNVTWKSSRKAVASVDQNGLVTAIKKGTAVITARAGNKKFTCKVTVKQPVTSVKLSKSEICLKKGKSYTLKASARPKSANNRSLKWTSSNKKVAKVNSKGNVSAVGVGTAVISAVSRDGTKIKAKCTVYVTKTGEWPLRLSSGKLSITVNQSSMLTTQYAKGKVKWSSSNTAAATVASDGTVKAVGLGTAVITATSKKETAACTVTVSAPNPSAQAKTFLSILNKYSQELQAYRAKGCLVGYSNAAKLNPDNWVPAMEEMDRKGTTYTNCALLVRWALREMGYIGTTQMLYGTDANTSRCHSYCYTGIHFGNEAVKDRILERCEIYEVHDTPANLVAAGKLIAGDICTWHGMQHTNVFAGTDASGNGLWYDAGRSASDGSYWKKAEILAFGISEETWALDKKNGGSNPSLKEKTYIFNSFGPVIEENRYKTGMVGYIIRIVK